MSRAVISVGCFDLFHRGHVALFSHMRQHGDYICVGVHDSQSMFRNKQVRPFESTRVRANNAKKYADEIFIVKECNPASAVAAQVEKLRKQGFEVAYMRGDDWKDFPGRDFLESANVPIIWHSYTKGVSSTNLRANFWLRFRLIPRKVATKTLELHENFVYKPLRIGLERFADHLPDCLSPNFVTFLSLLTVVPCVMLFSSGNFLLCALFVFIHDMLDRLDGAVAGCWARRGIKRDGRFGAYLDAMCDKCFGGAMLLTTFFYSQTHPLWTFVCLVKFMLHMTLAVVRTQDYFSTGPAAIAASGEGKLATCSENFSLLILSISLSARELFPLFVVALGFEILSIDMALKSLQVKLKSRY